MKVDDVRRREITSLVAAIEKAWLRTPTLRLGEVLWRAIYAQRDLDVEDLGVLSDEEFLHALIDVVKP